MKPTDLQIRQASEEIRDSRVGGHDVAAFIAGAKWAISQMEQDDMIEKVKELRDEYYNRNQSLGLKTFNEFIFKLNAIIEKP